MPEEMYDDLPAPKKKEDMLKLQTVQEKDRNLLWNLIQKYLYEMTNYYDDPMDEIGNYQYRYFDDYFSDPMRVAYFIFDDDILVGFALICPYSNIDQNPDYTMAEFTIFPAYRRRHYALDAAEMILDKHQGKWEIKYNEKNGGAKKLWNAVAASYELEVHHLDDEETVLAFEVKKKMGMTSNKKIRAFRTGGQSGVDRAAMDVAKEYGIPLCGWCPKDGWAEDYPKPPGLQMDYPELTETPSKETAQRTLWNMRDAEAILTIIPTDSRPSEGTDIGLKEGQYLGKPMFTASGPEDIPAILEWINGLKDEVELCIGGPRASECASAYEIAKDMLIQIVNTTF